MNVFIAGGTSGIGYSLAEYYLSQGNYVGVCDKDIANVSGNKSVNFRAYKADVCVLSSIQLALQTFLNTNEDLHIFINCTNSYSEEVKENIPYEEASEILQTNILGTSNCFEVAREFMKDQKNGRIAVIASVSGVLNKEKSSLYTKTKRSVTQIADTYYKILKPFGISVTTITPGYIDEVNNNDLSKKPFVMDINTATSIIVEAIDKRKKQLVFPMKMKWLISFLSKQPSSLLNVFSLKKNK